METTRIYRMPGWQRRLQGTRVRLPRGKNFRVKKIIDLDTGYDYSKSMLKMEGDSFVLDATYLPKHSERFLITTINDIGNDILRHFLDVRVSEVSSKEDQGEEKHWVVAAVKDKEVFTPL